MHIGKLIYISIFIFLTIGLIAQEQPKKDELTFEEYIKLNISSKSEIDGFLNTNSCFRYDAELGFIMDNYMPKDGIDNSSTLSTFEANGARTRLMYRTKQCRINTFGNS